MKKLAATYSRASYTGTTIGKTVFDGRVRDGIGSDHSFMATKKCAGELSVVSFAPVNGRPPNVKDHRLFDTNSAAHSTDHGRLTTNKPCSLKTTHSKGVTVREFKSPFFLPRRKKQAIKPHDRLVLVG